MDVRHFQKKQVDDIRAYSALRKSPEALPLIVTNNYDCHYAMPVFTFASNVKLAVLALTTVAS
jgi:hypothetical protein